jgi:predicted metal-dependent hydrolase
MTKVLIDNISYDYKVIYRDNKRIYIRFNNGIFEINAPFYTPHDTITQVLEKHQAQLRRLIDISRPIKTNISENEEVTLIDAKYLIKYGLKSMIIDKTMYLNHNNPFDAYEKLIKKLLETYAQSRINYFHNLMYQNQNYPSLIIKKVRTKLGHYHRDKHQIMLNLNLVYNRRELIDYVIVHELVHIQEFNHQPKFYQKLALVLPHYRKLERELKKVGSIE